jgi:hypothetical protein
VLMSSIRSLYPQVVHVFWRRFAQPNSAFPQLRSISVAGSIPGSSILNGGARRPSRR